MTILKEMIQYYIYKLFNLNYNPPLKEEKNIKKHLKKLIIKI